MFSVCRCVVCFVGKVKREAEGSEPTRRRPPRARTQPRGTRLWQMSLTGTLVMTFAGHLHRRHHIPHLCKLSPAQKLALQQLV